MGYRDKNKQNEYNKNYYHLRRKLFIKQLGGKCAKCGSTKQLEFDHINNDNKEFDLSEKIAGRSIKNIQPELKKCQLLCKDCHHIKTLKEMGHQRIIDKDGNILIHGTISSYSYCRCNKCKKAYSEYNKKCHKKRMETKRLLRKLNEEYIPLSMLVLDKNITHGTLASYKYCKCNKCKKAKNEYDKKYYREHRRNK